MPRLLPGRNFLSTTAVVLVSCVIALVLVEVAARVVLGPVEPRGVLLFSENPFRVDDGGFVRFAEDRTIRTLSVYGQRAEFDVRFKTNNRGFVDDRDYPLAPKARNIAVVGDSYAAGYHGGRPWVPRLRESLPDANIYNFGVTGTGFVQFANLLAGIKAALPIDEVAIVTISSDVPRRDWRPVVRRRTLSLCALETAKAACLGRPSAIRILGRDGSAAAVRSVVEDYYAALPEVGLRRYLSRHTYVGRLFHIRTWVGRGKAGLTMNPIPAFTTDPLRRIRRQFERRPVRLIHIPEKREVAAGAYYTDLKGAAEKAGLTFVDGLALCGLAEGDFFPHDPHPNAEGYEKIRRCVSRALASSSR